MIASFAASIRTCVAGLDRRSSGHVLELLAEARRILTIHLGPNPSLPVVVGGVRRSTGAKYIVTGGR